MVDSLRFRDWLNKSKMDIKAAKVLKANNCGNDAVAFHCQQAIEKAFKAYILYHTGEIPEGHSLVYLCKNASLYNNSYRGKLKDCAFVNQFYIETRYPADVPLSISDEETDECIKIAEENFTLVTNEIGEK